jgi:hypothetical protein
MAALRGLDFFGRHHRAGAKRRDPVIHLSLENIAPRKKKERPPGQSSGQSPDQARGRR